MIFSPQIVFFRVNFSLILLIFSNFPPPNQLVDPFLGSREMNKSSSFLFSFKKFNSIYCFFFLSNLLFCSSFIYSYMPLYIDIFYSNRFTTIRNYYIIQSFILVFFFIQKIRNTPPLPAIPVFFQKFFTLNRSFFSPYFPLQPPKLSSPSF